MALLAVAVVGILIRPGDPAASRQGALEVDREETPQASPEPTRTPRITRSTPSPSPGSSRSDEESIEGVLHGVWHDGAPAPYALPLNETTLVWDGAHGIYLVGGRHWEDTRTTFRDEVWRYDIAADTWSSLPSLPTGPLAGVAAVWTGEELVIWGGWGPTALTAAGAAYDPGRGAWRELPPSPLTPRYGAAAVATADGVLVLGGADHATGWADGARYDAVADRWEAWPEMPEAPPVYEMGLDAFAIDEQVIVYSPNQWGPAPSAPLRLRDGAWETTTLPEGRTDAAQLGSLSATADGAILALRSRWGSSLRGDLIVLPPDSQEWQTIGAVPLWSQDALAGALVSERYYVVIGTHRDGVAYDLLGKRWLAIPDVPATAHHHPLALIPTADGVVVMPPGPDGAVRRFAIDDEPAEDAS